MYRWVFETILWLEVGPSSNNSYIISSYYLQCLKILNVTARLSNADRGTEYSFIVEVLQIYFRFNDDDTAGGSKVSFIFFKDIRDRGIYDGKWNACGFVLRKGLNNTSSQWNQHRLQVKKNVECSPGIPGILYFFFLRQDTRSLHNLETNFFFHTPLLLESQMVAAIQSFHE